MGLLRWLGAILIIGLLFYIFYEGPTTKYVCPDKTVVTDFWLCEQEPQITGNVIKLTNYVCPDGNIVENPDGCEKPRKIILREYVCENGTVVINPLDCLPKTNLSESKSNATELILLIPEILDLESTSTTTTTTTKKTTTTVKTTTRKTTTTTIKKSSSTSCVALGCSSDTKYVGSKNSDKYYPCDSGYAKMVKRENIVCFSSDEDARSKGYIPCKRC